MAGFLDSDLSFPIEGVPLDFKRPRCPKCLSYRITVDRSMPVDKETGIRVQYRKCAECGHNFKTTLE
jgi:ribosomal protein S27AE